MKGGVLNKELSKKLLCFGVDRMNVFPGGKIKVIKKIKDFWASFSLNLHCVVHHTNLVVQSLGDLTFMTKTEIFVLNMYNISTTHWKGIYNSKNLFKPWRQREIKSTRMWRQDRCPCSHLWRSRSWRNISLSL